MIFKNCVGLVVDNILRYDYANDIFQQINGNIARVEWGAETLEAMAHILNILNNQYAPLAENY